MSDPVVWRRPVVEAAAARAALRLEDGPMITVEQLWRERLDRMRAEGGLDHDHRDAPCDRQHFVAYFDARIDLTPPTRELIAERIADRVAREETR